MLMAMKIDDTSKMFLRWQSLLDLLAAAVVQGTVVGLFDACRETWAMSERKDDDVESFTCTLPPSPHEFGYVGVRGSGSGSGVCMCKAAAVHL